ncbi:MAG TPA: DNA-directed RNA polymerase subunit omega [Bacillota bacterium]|nr:DNA-directed RNA polymerase subunit omega [Bacillota bacterium]
MLYPSVQDLTNDKVNRYMLVMATSKCARHITQMEIDAHNAELEKAEIRDPKNDIAPTDIKEKAVSLAVERIYDGRYKIETN